MTDVRDQQYALRRTIENALQQAALDCNWNCPDECRTHHPSVTVTDWSPADEPQDLDGPIDALSHVAMLAVWPEIENLRAELAEQREQAETYHGRWQKVWQRALAAEASSRRFRFAWNSARDRAQTLAVDVELLQRMVAGATALPACSCAATPAHQHGCDADTN